MLIALSLAPAAQARLADCEAEVRPDLVEGLSASRSQRILADLTTIYRNDPAFESAAKPLSGKTVDAAGLVWLKRFCVDYRIEYLSDFAGALFGGLRHVATIVKVYPNWQTVLSDPAFDRWAATLTPERQEQIQWIENFGEAGQVIALIKEYEASKPAAPPPELPPPAAAPPPLPDDAAQAISYGLTEDDFKTLRGKGEILERLSKLKDRPFPGEAALDAAVAEALQGLPERPAQEMALARKYALRATVYLLTENVLQTLKARGAPDYVAAQLAPLQNLPYAGQQNLADALNDAGEAISERFEQSLKPQVLSKFPPPPNCRLTAAALLELRQTLQGDALGAALLQKLEKIADQSFPSKAAAGAALDKAGKDLRGQFDRYVPIVAAQAETATRTTLTGEALESLGKDPLNLTPAPSLLVLLQSVQGIDYPDRELFRTAVRVKLAARLQGYLSAILEYAGLHGPTLTEASFGELEKTVPPELLDSLAALRGRSFADLNALRQALDEEGKRLTERFAVYEKTVLALARKEHRFDPGKPVSLEGNDCGCVHRHLAGPVYGFYPFWLAGQPLRVDFGGLSRLVYDRLGFDERGDLLDTLDPKALDPAFLSLARKYGTQVDWAVRRDDWQAWQGYSIDRKAYVLDRLAGHLAALSGTPLSDPGSRLTPYLSFGLESAPALADGFVLDFEGYPKDRDSINAFDDFVKTLEDRLRQDGNPHTLGILLARADLGQGIYAYDNLLRLIDLVTEKDTQQDIDIRFLVWLEEPFEESQKILRKAVEDGLTGPGQRKLMRKIVPVLEYDSADRTALEANIVYFQDNFGGIGFWPLAYETAAAPEDAQNSADAQPKAAAERPPETPAAILVGLLEAHFLTGNARPESAVCDFVCPNRQIFRAGFLTLLGALALLGSFYWRDCPCRAWLGKRLTAILAGLGLPFLASGLALLACDPPLAALSEGRWPIMTLFAAILAFGLWRYAKRKREEEKP